jgi:hypothetical protein
MHSRTTSRSSTRPSSPWRANLTIN